jgi:hypothetical protein
MTCLRFSIRDLIWLTALCAVLVAWWGDRHHLANELASVNQRYVAETKELKNDLRVHRVLLDQMAAALKARVSQDKEQSRETKPILIK